MVRIKILKFNVGDAVHTPKGKVGMITHIGAQTSESDGHSRIISIVYRVLGSYWAEWQLRKAKSNS